MYISRFSNSFQFSCYESNTKITKTFKSLTFFLSVAYKDKKRRNTASYDDNYKCIKCQEGCDSCVDSSPCLATYHWGLRYQLM